MVFKKYQNSLLYIFVFGLFLFVNGCGISAEPPRQKLSFNDGWESYANDSLLSELSGFEHSDFSFHDWESVNVPHNWDKYHGFRRLMHGNFHGYAWYRKTFDLTDIKSGHQYFLEFEGVGSYATVWVNGKLLREHSGGRTVFTLDVKDALIENSSNLIAVRVGHPASIRDLPWVCGGCSPEWGFSEGSQPFGIFRPVNFIVTSDVRVEPFGVHIWNDTTISEKEASLFVNTEVKNYSELGREIEVENLLINGGNQLVAQTKQVVYVDAGKTIISSAKMDKIKNPKLWSPDSPYLYTMQTRLYHDGELLDEVVDSYGIRWVKWDVEPVKGEGATNRFYLNGEPVFLNGTAEYEHLMGRSHAFTDEMVQSRVEQIRSAGFNLFRDAHQPHNLRYNKYWDELGMLWWPQMSAHIWFDNPEFRENFKARLRDFIKERRNSPSNVLWGLQNESVLPEGFARECTEIFREMDPTASIQRVVTTCNGGTGTDWNVVQNWSGTYGGDPTKYDEDLKRQVFNGEYGAWRSAGLHAEGEFDQEGAYTEERMWQLMEMKVRLAEKVSQESCGHIQWLFASHENPGRIQSGEGSRELDRVGPVNYKGLFSIWGEPLDVYYMYRANYADGMTDPMVYIVSHSWPDRFTLPGLKNDLTLFSNCEEVELFNDVGGSSLGRKTNPGRGLHFTWDNVPVNYNVLYAVGYNNGKAVAKDLVLLNHLESAPGLEQLKPKAEKVTAPNKNEKYLYRVNCGGDDYVDGLGNLWSADVQWKDSLSWGSLNWTDDFENLPGFYASQREAITPVSGTREWPLFQTYRFGMDRLRYRFPLSDGTYKVELFFMEPWYGVGGAVSCEKWRMFDVVANGKTIVNDLDIWKEAGTNSALKKTAMVEVKDGLLEISFSDIKSSQAVISAISISTLDNNVNKALPPASGLITNLKSTYSDLSPKSKKWLSTGKSAYQGSESKFSYLPPSLYGAEWIQLPAKQMIIKNSEWFSFILNDDAWVFVAVDGRADLPTEFKTWNTVNDTLQITGEDGGILKVRQKKFAAGAKVVLPAPNDGRSYIVAVNEAHGMDDAIDLRTTETFYARDGNTKGATAKQVLFKSKDCVTMETANQDAVEFIFSVGLASKYGLHFRYMNMSDSTMPVKMEIVSLDETIQWSGIVEFPSASEKWKSKRTDTGTTINAGTYKIRLSSLKNGKFYFDWLQVQ
ncbi:MAG TPA: malectin domain-containing carbohydrate-binding protein [Marinilabiliaceae bacterium]|nr:malectin domain-containing carbohydrate-binding protein [Marinilabiliaceae bacterium]